MSSLDLSILQWFNSFAGHSVLFDKLVALFTNGSPVIFAVLFAFYFLRRKGDVLKTRRTVLLSGLSGCLAIAVAMIVGHFMYRARPFAVLPPDQIRLLIAHPADASFPSDHTMGSAAFAAGMWRAPGRSAAWIFTIAAVLVGASRLVAGVHWPSDVVGSLVLGALVAAGTFALERPLTPLLDWILKLANRVVPAPARSSGGRRRD